MRDADYLTEIENWVDRYLGIYSGVVTTPQRCLVEIAKTLDRWRASSAATQCRHHCGLGADGWCPDCQSFVTSDEP